VVPIATIRDLARRSGVSIATVSRALNGYADVNEETRQRIIALARELDYSPSEAARTLVRQRSQMIGVVWDLSYHRPDLQHPFLQEVLIGLKQGLGAQGYDLLLLSTFGPRGKSYVKRSKQHRVDGVVIMGVDEHTDEIQELVQSDVPTVAIDLDIAGPRSTYVTSDNVQGAKSAVHHLHALGHRAIATITGPHEMRPGAERLVGYREALAELGLEVDPRYVVEGDFYHDTGQAAMHRLLDSEDRPTAVFAASDMMAMGAIRAAAEAGCRVPEDVAIVGFDDIVAASLVQPRLTTVRQDKDGFGAAAANALIRVIEDPDTEPQVVTLPTELVIRESCGAANGGSGPRTKEVGRT
jgi:LacI family transcriptional regulator